MSTFNGPFGKVNTAILLDRYIKAYENACDMIAQIQNDIEALKNQMIDADDIKEAVTPLIDESLTILPIERLADFGTDTNWDGQYVNISVNANMQNPTNYLFKMDIRDGFKGYKIRFVNADKSNRFLAMGADKYDSLLYHITNDAKNKKIIMYEYNYGSSKEIYYDNDGNFVKNDTTSNVTSYNVLDRLNRKTKSDSYSPTADTDIATKGYVDNAQISQSPSIHYVDVTITGVEPDAVFDCNVNFEQIEAIIDGGEQVICTLTLPESFLGSQITMYALWYKAVPQQSVTFVFLDAISDNGDILYITFTPDGISYDKA